LREAHNVSLGEPLLLGVVGGGEAATKALRAISGEPAVTVQAVCCLPHELPGVIDDSVRAADYEKMLLREDVEAVFVATPVGTHVALAKAALEAGKHVLIEKPVATSSSEAATLLPITDRVVAVAFKKRFSDAVRYVRAAADDLDNARIGIEWQIPWPATPWRYDPQCAGGGALMDLGSHALDLAEFFFGRIEEISATTVASSVPGIEAEASVELRYLRKRCSGIIKVQWGSGALQRIAIESSSRQLMIERAAGAHTDVVSDSTLAAPLHFPQRSEYLGMFAELRRAIRREASAVPLLAAGIRNLQLIERAYVSAERHAGRTS
jgi:predicted dehydrogenase